MNEQDCQGAINGVRKDLQELRERIVKQETRTEVSQRDVEKIQTDMLNLHATFKGDMQALQAAIKTDIDGIRTSITTFVTNQTKSLTELKDSISQLATRQAVDEAKLQTSVSAGKYFIDKLPVIASVIAAVAGVIVMVKVSGL
jgi:chromosome segregation ATPase